MGKPERNRGLLWASGSVVPEDGSDGYQKACVFLHTDGDSGSLAYINEGTVTSSNFQAGGGGDETIADLADVADAFATRLLETGTYQSTASGGVTLSATNTRPFTLLYDDAGVALGGGATYRGFLSRILLTKDTSAVTVFSARGQLKLVDLVDVATGIYAPVQGYIEVAGTSIASSGATLSCLSASLEITTALTAASGGEIAGLHVETTGAGTLTATGTVAGILIDKAAGAADWPVGISVLNSVTALEITGASAYAIDIATSGVFRMGVQDTGIDLTTAYPFAIDVQCEANANIVAGATGTTAGVYVRYAIETDQTSNTAHVAMFGKLRVKKDLADGNHAGVMGWLEISGAGTVIGGISTTHTSAGSFAVIADSSFELTTGFLSGVLVDCSVDDGSTITGTLAGIRLKRSSGCFSWATGIQFAADSATSCIDIACATTPNTSRTNHGFVMGGRGADELTVTFAGGVGAENYEPVALNFDLVGTNPASTSTINIIQQGLYHDTDDMANLRLKCADWWVTVNKNVKDVYCIQNEIAFGAGTVTASGEVSVLGLVLDGGGGTLTCPYYHGINMTMRGASTPANATGVFIRVESGATIANGIELRAEGTMTASIRLGNISGDECPSHFVAVPAVGTGVTSGAAQSGDGDGSIKILVGGVTRYLQFWNAAS
jgi:hypothetical protein